MHDEQKRAVKVFVEGKDVHENICAHVPHVCGLIIAYLVLFPSRHRVCMACQTNKLGD